MRNDESEFKKAKIAHMQRVKNALRQYDFYSEKEIDIIADSKVFRFFLNMRIVPKQESTFYNFLGKTNDVIDYFATDGLTRSDYLKAAIRQPQLFCQSPKTLTKNIELVVDHFKDDGLTLAAYLKAAIRQPPLFYQSPRTLIKNIELVVDHFKDDDLTLATYLKAAIRHSQLFCQSPKTLIKNIELVVDHFKDDGLTQSTYLKAAICQPQLFYQSSKTLIKNIELVVDCFKDHGLTLATYLKAAIRQPQLFYQSPETISGHINLYKKLYKSGKITINKKPYDPLDQKPYQPLFEYLIKSPKLLTRSDQNIQLRDVYVALLPEYHGMAKPIRESRIQISQEIREYLGHKNVNKPLSKLYDLEMLTSDLLSKTEEELQAKNLLHRGLVRANLLPDELANKKQDTKYQDKIPTISIKPDSGNLGRDDIERGKGD